MSDAKDLESSARALAMEMFCIFFGVAQPNGVLDAREPQLEKARLAAMQFQADTIAACRQIVRLNAESTWRGGLFERSDALTEVIVDIDRKSMVPGEWQPGTGLGLPRGTLAWIETRRHGVVWAQLTSDFFVPPGAIKQDECEQRFVWGAYSDDVGEMIDPSEVFRYQVMRRPT